MGGLCGIFHFNHQALATDALFAMAAAVPYRGQAVVQVSETDPVALVTLLPGLATDLLCPPGFSDLGWRTGDFVAGDFRIDNRTELIEQLRHDGYLKADCPSDDAIVLAAYRQWGTNCPTHFLGDFAFALWDSQQQHLFAACDVMGMRSLHYRWQAGTVLLATEVKQILAIQTAPAQINEPMLGVWLAGYAGDPTWTFYENIWRLPPGHALLVTESDIRTWQYWSVDPKERIRYRHEDDYAEHFRELFIEAVRCRIDQQPVGLFLSGGVDSGCVAAAIGRCHQQDEGLPPFRAYSYAFDTLPQCDERHISDLIAKHYGFPVTAVPAETAYPLANYPESAPDQDGPLMGAYTDLHILTLKMAHAEGCRVMLSGSHGDQMVGGGIVDGLGMVQAGLWQTLWQELGDYGEWKQISRLQAFNRLITKPALGALLSPEKYRQLRRRLKPIDSRKLEEMIPWWIDPTFAKRIDLAELIQKYPLYETYGSAQQQRRQISVGSLESRGVTWGERLYARYGLIRADPWSDRRILSFVNAIPQHQVNRLGKSKRLARRAMKTVMPELARTRIGKIYPDALYRQAIRQLARDTFADLVHNSVAGQYGYLNVQALAQQFETTLSEESDTVDFWPALTVEMWMRHHWQPGEG